MTFVDPLARNGAFCKSFRVSTLFYVVLLRLGLCSDQSAFQALHRGGSYVCIIGFVLGLAMTCEKRQANDSVELNSITL